MHAIVQNVSGKKLYEKEVDHDSEDDNINGDDMLEKFGQREPVTMVVTFKEGNTLEQAMDGAPGSMVFTVKDHPDDDTIPTDHEGAE